MKSPGITTRPILTIGGDHEVNQVFFEDAQPLRYSGTTGNIALGIAASFRGNAMASNPESRDSPMCHCTSEVWSGACHRAAQSADPLGPSRNDSN
jgi:hypothetical protein